MLNIIDIVGIIIVLISAIIALKKGFVKTFFDFTASFVALILAFALCNVGVVIIKDNTTIDEWLTNTITESLKTPDTNNVGVAHQGDPQKNEINQNNNPITETLENLPQNIKDIVGMEDQKEAAKEVIIENSVEIIIKILSWVLIYVLVRLILMVLCFVFNGIMSLPFLKQINNLTGLLLGTILGLFRIYVVLAFISFLTSVVTMDAFIALIKNSLIISIMYENNILLGLIL